MGADISVKDKMSNNKKLTTEIEENKEEMLYRPQLLRYKYKTCIEIKGKMKNNSYIMQKINKIKALFKIFSALLCVFNSGFDSLITA